VPHGSSRPICRRIRSMRLPGVVLGFLITVSSPLLAQLTITTTKLPFGGLNQQYMATITDSGAVGFVSWTISSGSLPPGVNLDVEVGTLFGAPTLVGTFNFTVTATDNQTAAVATKQLSIGVMQIANVPQLPDASTCSVYSQKFVVSDGPAPPFTWSIASNSFSNSFSKLSTNFMVPTGLTLDPSTGVLSGTPTTGGDYSFTIIAFSPSANISASKVFSLTVSTLCLLGSTLPNGDVNSFYRQSLIASGGAGPYMWQVKTGGLPAGVSIDANTGLLSGTPTTAGNYSFTIQLKDSAGAIVTQDFVVTINPALAFTTTSPLTGGTSGAAYSETIAATGGMTPYVFSTSNPPTGLTLSAAGVLSGTPSAGAFTFTATVTDSLRNSISMDFKLTIASAGPVLQVSPSAITFTAVFEGDAPVPQSIDVVPIGTQPVGFQVAVDGGANVVAPAWISVTTTGATAPARIVVHANQGTLATQTSTARVRIMDSSGTPTIVLVTLKIVNGAPQLQVVPDTLHFAARSGTPGTLVEILGVRSIGGGGPISFNTFLQNNSSWISGVTPASGTTVPNSTVFLKVQVNTQGLQVGSYHDVILFSSNAATISVPVALFVSGNGAILGLDVSGIRFQARVGGGFSNPQTVQVLDVGDPASSLAWTADFVTGSQFFSASATSGTASPSNPSTLVLTPTASALQMPAGGYYGLLKISSSQALNSPLYVVLVLDMESAASPPLPDPTPAGLVFIAPAGKPLAAGQTVNINTSSAAPTAFQVSTMTADGGNWLIANPTTGTATGQTPGQITVTVDPSLLAAGIYSGEVDISMSGVLRSVNITLIVQPAAGPVSARAVPAAANCTPAKLALTEIGLANNFGVPAGWPAALTVQLNDDCGNAVPNGSVTASFSNGDPPLMLRGSQPGAYSATWQPGVVSSQMAVTIQAQAGQLTPATTQLIGSINNNPNKPPVLNENGTVNTFNRVQAGALSPGMIVEVYGTGLATTQGNPGVLPLPTSFQGTSLIVGPFQAPLYFISGGQVNVQFAAELTPNQQYPVIAILNGALSVPVITDISPDQLGLAAQPDGHVIAQHGADSSYVTASHPAKPGEVLVIYLSGMGPTNPSVKSGAPAPGSEPLARVTVAPVVTLDGNAATVQFAGLSPGFVGLYQVNFQVPAGARTGDLTLIVSQGTVASNATRLPVAQ
jgi:uncharacterized protein (TIGR03437 family)